jgi:hypothetical protein
MYMRMKPGPKSKAAVLGTDLQSSKGGRLATSDELQNASIDGAEMSGSVVVSDAGLGVAHDRNDEAGDREQGRGG